MMLPKVLNDNLRFLVLEVEGQLTTLQSYFETLAHTDASRILERRGYAANLKQHIHDVCVEQMSSGTKIEIPSLRAIESIASKLERITELCRNCIRQTTNLRDIQSLELSRFSTLIKRVLKGIQFIEKAFQDNDSELALKIGRTEQKMDGSYQKILENYANALKKSEDVEDLIRGLFVAHAIEQMGDVMFEISESILSSNFGQPLDMERYYSLKESIGELVKGGNFSDIEVQSVALTKSGSNISAIKNAEKKAEADDNETLAIFKDGTKKKLKEEKQGVESWHEIFPGLAPRIINYKKRGESAAMLIEHLEGHTFEQIILQSSDELRQKALKSLTKTLKKVWNETRDKKGVCANYMQQMEKRLPDVFAMHPTFETENTKMCGLEIPSLRNLSQQAQELENKLTVPFSVYIHGDFNVDNIIYDPIEEKTKFIDLHRSRYLDYVQDISVFIVSNYRLQVFDTPVRKRIACQINDFYKFAQAYAIEKKDETFEFRLALGLVRSLVTSTRFILDRTLSKTMMLRARYLLEQVVRVDPKRNPSYQVPVGELFDA